MKENSYAEQMARLTARKNAQTHEKLSKLGFRDEDDYGLVLPPESFKADLPVRDATGQFSGPRAWAMNFRWLMEHHPLYIDPDDAIAGRWMFMLSRMRLGYQLSRSNFAFDYSHLEPLQKKYDITTGIGKDAHFAPDYQIGLDLGWGGLLEKVRAARLKFCAGGVLAAEDAAYAIELMDAEEQAILGVQAWIRRFGEAAADRTMSEDDPTRRANLAEMARICLKLVDQPPETLREVVQWIAIFNMVSRTYNRDGAGGQLDELLRPYYERDPHYYQLGGPDGEGKDQTSRMSYIILEAAAKLKASCNLTIRVWDGMDRALFRRGVEILLENKLGYPRFSGDKALVEGFMKNGYDASLARRRIAVGCNWMSLPGLEYTLNDVVKINIAKVFEVAFGESHSLAELEANYLKHFRIAFKTVMDGIDFHLDHQYLNEPELMLNLLSHGPIEKGKDVSHGGAMYYNMACDGAGLGTVADSFAAVEQRVQDEKSLTWDQLAAALASDFSGDDGERIQKLLLASDRYGHGGTRADRWAKWLTKVLVDEVANHTTPKGFKMIPGWFSWADTLRFGRTVGATPNGRKAGEAISHGANPNPGFRSDGALTAMARAVAEVQPGYGNTAPWQLELDLGFVHSDHAVEKLMALMEAHFNLGGTLININIVDADEILDAHAHPERHPDLIVRVTGFSAYFTSLSPAFRQLVVKRLIREAV